MTVLRRATVYADFSTSTVDTEAELIKLHFSDQKQKKTERELNDSGKEEEGGVHTVDSRPGGTESKRRREQAVPSPGASDTRRQRRIQVAQNLRVRIGCVDSGGAKSRRCRDQTWEQHQSDAQSPSQLY